MRRVVITGVGIVSPLGSGNERVWKKIVAGHSGIRALPKALVTEGVPVHAAGLVPVAGPESDYRHIIEADVEDLLDSKAIFGRSVDNEMNMITQFGVYASDLALAHASQPLQSGAYSMDKAGVILATGGVGPLDDIHRAYNQVEKSARRLSPYFIPKTLTNMTGGHISLRHGTKGPLLSPSSACAASAHAIGDAYNYIRMGYADVILAGGSEAAVNPLSISGFARMKALSNTIDPLQASRPFDADRNGFVIAEGACVLVIEEMEKAIARGAPILAEICGYGLSSDAHHITSPSPKGEGASRSMQMALDDAGVLAKAVGYINAHATSTPTGDEIEALAIAQTFEGAHSLLVSSTKGATGHLLGAAGALEVALTALTVRDGTVPPTVNLHKPPTLEKVQSFEYVLDGKGRKHPNLAYALNNSFGFGGTNASVLLGRL